MYEPQTTQTKVHLLKFVVNYFFSHFYQVCISKWLFHSRSSHFTFGSDCTVLFSFPTLPLLFYFIFIFIEDECTYLKKKKKKPWTFCMCHCSYTNLTWKGTCFYTCKLTRQEWFYCRNVLFGPPPPPPSIGEPCPRSLLYPTRHSN